jgi:hypothetical protein
MMREEKRKKYRLDCYKDSPVPHYIEVIEGTEKQLDKAVEELTRKGFNVVIKNFNQEDVMSKETKNEKVIKKADEILKKAKTKTAKKKIGEKLGKSQVKTKFSGNHKPQLSGAVERKCAICSRKSFSAWAFVKVGKKMKRKGTEKLTQNDFVCRDITTCKEKK